MYFDWHKRDIISNIQSPTKLCTRAVERKSCKDTFRWNIISSVWMKGVEFNLQEHKLIFHKANLFLKPIQVVSTPIKLIFFTTATASSMNFGFTEKYFFLYNFCVNLLYENFGSLKISKTHQKFQQVFHLFQWR